MMVVCSDIEICVIMESPLVGILAKMMDNFDINLQFKGVSCMSILLEKVCQMGLDSNEESHFGKNSMLARKWSVGVLKDSITR